MEHIVGIDNNLLIKWKLLRNDGNPFPVDQYACRLFVMTARGRTEIKDFSISGTDSNIVSWEMNDKQLRFVGTASLAMSIMRKGRQIASVEHREAFRVAHHPGKNCDCNQTLEISSFVNILHPEEVAGTVTVLFPSFEVDENMHLHMIGATEQYNSNFELEENGHLIYKNN